MTDILLIESLLIEVTLALDQSLLDENAVTPRRSQTSWRALMVKSKRSAPKTASG